MRNKAIFSRKENDIREGFRLSLKCSQTNRKKNQGGRLSIPIKLRKQNLQTRNSFESTLFKSKLSNDQNRPVRRQAIVQNLIKKLDEEQELRNIIQIKFRKTNCCGFNNLYHERYQSKDLRQKLKNCEEELGLFKHTTSTLHDSNYLMYQEINDLINNKCSSQRLSLKPNPHRNPQYTSIFRQPLSNKQFFQNIDKTLEILNNGLKFKNK